MTVSYDESTASNASGSLTSVIAGLESSLSDLGGFVASVKSNWQGDEQDTYSGMQTKWDNAAATVNEILASVSKALESNTSSVQGMRSQVRSALTA